MSNLDKLIKHRQILLNYLDMKVSERDWHGVADAAMDLRELEVEIKLEPLMVNPINPSIRQNQF